jgi:hypothetical protein
MTSKNPPPLATHLLQISTEVRPPKNPCADSLSSKPHARLGHDDQTLLHLITATCLPTTLIYSYVLEKSFQLYINLRIAIEGHIASRAI